jgi:membrane-associated phospholipid phosphatase
MSDSETPQLVQHSGRRMLRDGSPRLDVLLVLMLAGFIGAIALDGLAYRHVGWPQEGDLYRLLRVHGYLPTIMVFGAAISLIDRRHVPRAVHILLCAAASGLAAEIVKALVGRERPIAHDGVNFFKPFLSGFADHSNLAFPSSHTAVAFGAAWMACYFFPRGRWLWLGLAIGCGLTRIAVKAHWLSDCYAAAMLAYLVCRALRPLAQPQMDPDAG